MKIYRETIVAGKTIIRSLRASTRIKIEKGRKPNRKPTPEAVMKVNFRNAVRKLTMLLNHNFDENSYHLTLTYKREPTNEEARKTLKNFIRNTTNRCRKQGSEFKWVAVTEYEHKRIHHHIVCSGADEKTIQRYWNKGFVNFKGLDASGNYQKLAEYLLKETEKTFRRPDSTFKRRYSTSRNIIMPEIKREEVSPRELNQDPRPVKGYYIDKDTYRRYEHAVLGVDCVEYIMVSLTKEPRIKRWRPGEVSAFERHYKVEQEEQMEWMYE